MGWGRVVVFYFRVLVNVCVCVSSVRVLGGWGTVVAFCFCVLGNVYSYLLLRLCVDAIFVSNVASPARAPSLSHSHSRARTHARGACPVCLCVLLLPLQAKCTGLYIAARKGHKDVAELLLDRNADVNSVNGKV